MMKKVILKGYYGRDNFGDEIMMDLIISFFKENYPQLQLQVMNSNPEMVLKKYGIETPKSLVTGSYGKMGIFKRVLSIIKADCYVIGGGTIITDKHSILHLVEYSIELILRKILGKPSVFISIGATKFKHKMTKFLCRIMFQCCDLCMVRDHESYLLLRKIYNKSKIVETGDMVLLAFNKENNKLSKNLEIKNIGFSLMPYYESLYKKNELDIKIAQKFAEVINKLSEEGYYISLIPIQFGDNNKLDYYFSKTVQKMCKSKVEVFDCKDNQEKMKKIATMDFLVSMRLHSLLYAISNNIKSVAINHNEKINSCLKVYGIEDQAVTLENISNIVDIIHLLEKKKVNFDDIVLEEYNKAEKNFNYLSLILNKLVEKK